MFDDEVEVTAVDLARTRVLLAQRVGEQERLAAELNRTGLTSFADRADWLIAHRSADEHLAWVRKWAALGLADPEPRAGDWRQALAVPRGPVAVGERFTRTTLAAPRRKRPKHHPGLLTPDEQMAIALRVFDQLTPEQQTSWKRPRPSLAHEIERQTA